MIITYNYQGKGLLLVIFCAVSLVVERTVANGKISGSIPVQRTPM